MRLCFVSVRRHNRFMTELLAMIAAAVADTGVEVDVAFDEFPVADEPTAYMVIPHEFYGHSRPATMPTPAQRARTIALCTENPGTPWFEHARSLLPLFGAGLAINRSSMVELRRRGVSCDHLQLGYSRLWDQWHGDERSERALDILYLAAQDPRRDAIIAGYGRRLARHRCELLVPRNGSRATPAADYLVGIEKHRRLRSARLLLNLHRRGADALEWVRFLEAACNGAVMLTEPCIDHLPLVPGEHFISGGVASLPLLADRLLDDPDRLRRVRQQAYAFVRDQLPMAPSAERIADLAAEVLRPSSRTQLQLASPQDEPTPPPPPEPQRPAAPTRYERLSAAVRGVDLQVSELRREVDTLAYQHRCGRAPELEVVHDTPAFEDASPRVSVIVTVHNYEREIVEALASVAQTPPGLAFDVLVLDDASSDGSIEAVTAFAQAHPWLPMQMVRQPVNRGLARARNTLLQRARGEYVFVLDADNGVYPSALGRLTEALDADLDASFAYPMITVLKDGGPGWLMNALPWEPSLLRQANYIDAMALLRRSHVLALGGFTTDPRLTGWEDFHLWCTCAENGRHGVLVPQVLAWYRRSEHSMISDVETSTLRAWSVMRARFPALLAPARDGVPG